MALLKSGYLGSMDVWLGVNGPPSQSQILRISTEFICSHPLCKVYYSLIYMYFGNSVKFNLINFDLAIL